MNLTAFDINMMVDKDFDYPTGIKIFVGLFAPILSFFIIFLNWGIIYYEKFGNDPLKRDLSNMLFSSFCKSILIATLFVITVMAIEIIFGPILTSIAIFLQISFT